MIKLRQFLLIIILGCSACATTANNSKTIIKSVKDFGAIPNDGKDDSKAFAKAADWFSNKYSQNINYPYQKGKLIIPAGNYIIGKPKYDYTIGNSKQFSRQAYPIVFGVKSNPINGLEIIGEKSSSGKILSKLSYPKGLYFGCFNPSTRQKETNRTRDNDGDPGTAFFIGGRSQNVTIKNLEIDGRADHYIIGGQTRAKGGWQNNNIGIAVNNGAKYIDIENVFIHHFGMDGLYVRTDFKEPPTNKKWNIRLINVKSYYNGRQAFSWTGGKYLYAKNCEFNYTGYFEKNKIGIVNSPGANVDIEKTGKDGRTISNGLFDNCKMLSNYGRSASLNLATAADNVTFNNCDISSNRVYAVYMGYTRYRNFVFSSCNINGTISAYKAKGRKLINSGFTIFQNCNIKNTSKNMPKQPLFRILDRFKLNNCTLETSGSRNFFVMFNNLDLTLKKNEKNIINNCTFINNSSTSQDFGRMQGVSFTGSNSFENKSKNNRTTNIYNSKFIGGNNQTANISFSGKGQFGPTIRDFYIKKYGINSSIVFGEHSCERINVDIDNGAIFNSNNSPIYIGKKATLNIFSGSKLLVGKQLYLQGKINIKNGGELVCNNSTIYLPRNSNIIQHIDQLKTQNRIKGKYKIIKISPDKFLLKQDERSEKSPCK